MGSEANESRNGERRRRANVIGGRRHRHVVKVSPEEEALLLQVAAAQGITVPRLLVESALSAEAGETPTERRNAVAELFKLIRLMAAISNNVNQIARHANATGEVAADVRATLDAVRRTAERANTAIEGLTY